MVMAGSYTAELCMFLNEHGRLMQMEQGTPHSTSFRLCWILSMGILVPPQRRCCAFLLQAPWLYRLERLPKPCLLPLASPCWLCVTASSSSSLPS